MCCGWGEREFIWNINECSTKSPKGSKMSSHANRGQADFRFLVFFGLLVSLCVLVSGADAAPAAAAAAAAESTVEIHKGLKSAASGLKHLHRLKRDAEISFGNSQNEPRDKKSANDSAGTAANLKSELAPAPAAAVNEIPAQQPLIVAAGLAANNHEAAAAGSAAETNSLNDKAKDDDNDDSVTKEQNHEEESQSRDSNSEHTIGEKEGAKSFDSPLIGREDDHVTEEENEDNSAHIDDDDDGAMTEVQHKEVDDGTEYKQDHEDQHSTGEDAAADEENKSHFSGIAKRSAPAMTAESMGSNFINTNVHQRSRIKRDLGYDELREMINAGQAYPGSLPYDQGEGEGYPLPSYTNLDVEQANYEPGDDNWLSPGVESNLEDSFLLPTRKEEAIEKEIVRYEVLQRLLKEKEEEQAKEAVLEYLIAAAEDRLNEAVEEEKEAELEEKLEKIAANSNSPLFESANQYEVNKRYPYSYEPYGGPWGAMVPGVKRAGSNWYEPVDDEVDNYDRLYRLAEALGDNK